MNALFQGGCYGSDGNPGVFFVSQFGSGQPQQTHRSRDLLQESSGARPRQRHLQNQPEDRRGEDGNVQSSKNKEDVLYRADMQGHMCTHPPPPLSLRQQGWVE